MLMQTGLSGGKKFDSMNNCAYNFKVCISKLLFQALAISEEKKWITKLDFKINLPQLPFLKNNLQFNPFSKRK